MRRAGVPETVAMHITGHRTTSMFRHYNIVDDRDLTQAMVLTQQYIKTLPKERDVDGLKQDAKGNGAEASDCNQTVTKREPKGSES